MQSESSPIPVSPEHAQTPGKASLWRVAAIIMAIVFGPALLAWCFTMFR